ncbi:MAG: hypothetical protein FWC13_11725 [Oscillospiraceae bacterium]|nr:hypothetical protein [Oscillospiraceae bacterium]
MKSHKLGQHEAEIEKIKSVFVAMVHLTPWITKNECSILWSLQRQRAVRAEH